MKKLLNSLKYLWILVQTVLAELTGLAENPSGRSPWHL